MDSTNTFKSLQPNYKDTYSGKKRFGRLKKTIGKAHAERDASRNPEKFLKENKNPSIKGLKGVAL